MITMKKGGVLGWSVYYV